ncbi:MAG: MiaB/RimO family radical SAM methylthiotransferase [Nitrospiraceae bacterium]|nr:MiaB/RimO family radical SAM methylthiotransferase [Nitrospiraceae bacterium]
MRVALLSLGCKVNQSELAGLSSALGAGRRATIVGIDENPEICVINTCAVTTKSEYQSRQLIRRAAETGARVIVTGCYAELNPQAVEDMKGVASVVSNKEKESIIEMISGKSSSYTLDYGEKGSSKGRSRYFLKIQDGCDYACSYCIVRKARGPAWSVAPDEVIAGVRRAVDEGYREVVLTGVHLGLYGRDIGGCGPGHPGPDRPSLSRMVERILNETDVSRVRLSSIEINEVDDRLLELLKGDRLARHLHLPLQSGDDRILRLMKRRYDSAIFIRKVEKVVKDLRLPGLGTDVIVGFPGEGEDEFQNTVSVIRQLPFTYVHVFAYSPRPGTEAAGFCGKVHGLVKKRRSAILRELAGEKRRSFIESLRGEVLEVLVEGDAAAQVDGVAGLRGVAGNYVKVLIPHEYSFSGGIHPGNLVNVEIVGQKEAIAVGKPVINT